MIKDPGGHYTKQEVEEVRPRGREGTGQLGGLGAGRLGQMTAQHHVTLR